MKLYLSSYEIGASSDTLLSLIGDNKRAGIITNASDGFKQDRRHGWVTRAISTLSELGLDAHELDLRQYFGNLNDLEQHLNQLGLIWAIGGNTFILRRAMRESGFDQLLPHLLEKADIVYGGFSAGACVLVPSLRGIHLADEPEKTASGYNSEIIWDGLNLVDFYFVPHYRSVHRESQMMEDVIQYYENHHMKYYALADGEALVINGSTFECVGYPTAPSTEFR